MLRNLGYISIVPENNDMTMNVKQCFKIRHVGSCVLDLLITCLLFALGFSDAHAEGDGLQDENKEWALEVKLIDGQTVVWPIAKMPVTTFSADSVTLSIGDMSVSYLVDDLAYYRYKKINSSSNGISSSFSDNVSITISDGWLKIRGVKPFQRVTLSDMSGVVRGDWRCTELGCFQVLLESYPSGVYVLCLDKNVVKFILP